jgi:hypothetical protein
MTRNLMNSITFTYLQCRDVVTFGFKWSQELPFYSEQNSLLDHDVSGRSIYCSPPWSLAIECVEHLRACHSRSPLDTKAIIVLANRQSLKG